jgi:GT2 family glycosyltransferase
LALLIEDLQSQTLKPQHIEVVRGISPSGKARNLGVAQTTGETLVFLDDDVRLGSKDVIEVLVRCLKADKKLGMVGTAQLLPPDSTAFQRRCARQISRSVSSVVETLTESDMVTTACCAMRREVLSEVGGYHDRIIRGVDPELRRRVRKAGYRIAVAPNSWHYHAMPSDLSALLRIAWRNGAASAYARRHFPEAVLFNPEGHVSEFDATPSLPARILRNAVALGGDLLSGRVYGALYSMAYLGGNLTGK